MLLRRRTAKQEPVVVAPRQTEAPAALLRRLQWTVLRPLARYLGGEQRSLVRGPGMELNELRPYQPGDDVRHIDWNISARTDQPYIRESHVERALDAWLLIDLSASIDWGTAQCLKRDRTVEFVATAGQVLGNSGQRLGAVFFAARPLGVTPPAIGRMHLLRLLSRVRETPRQASHGSTDLAAALELAGKAMRRRSLVLVVSDFIVADGWQPALGKLAQRHEVVAVRLRDPREAVLPDVGMVTLEDPETGSQLFVNTSDRRLRERYAQAAARQADQITQALKRCGADQLVLSTNDELLPALVHFLQTQRLRRATPGVQIANARRA